MWIAIQCSGQLQRWHGTNGMNRGIGQSVTNEGANGNKRKGVRAN